jgi:hypothetical protein
MWFADLIKLGMYMTASELITNGIINKSLPSVIPTFQPPISEKNVILLERLY